MSNNNVGYNERRYRRLRAIFRDDCRRNDVGCCWTVNGTCRYPGQPIAWEDPPRTPRTFTVEHLTPRSLGGSRDDPANWACSHYGCNSARGNGTTRGLGTRRTTRPTPTPTDPHSETWP